MPPALFLPLEIRWLNHLNTSRLTASSSARTTLAVKNPAPGYRQGSSCCSGSPNCVATFDSSRSASNSCGRSSCSATARSNRAFARSSLALFWGVGFPLNASQAASRAVNEARSSSLLRRRRARPAAPCRLSNQLSDAEVLLGVARLVIDRGRGVPEVVELSRLKL